MQTIVQLTTLEEKYHIVEQVRKSFEIKIDIMGNNLTTVKKCLVGKDKIKKMEEANHEQNIKIEQLKQENENIWNNIENLKDSLLKGPSSVDIFKCKKCYSVQGLKTSTKRKNADMNTPNHVCFAGKLLTNLLI
jgi:hypothetical protein